VITHGLRDTQIKPWHSHRNFATVLSARTFSSTNDTIHLNLPSESEVERLDAKTVNVFSAGGASYTIQPLGSVTEEKKGQFHDHDRHGRDGRLWICQSCHALRFQTGAGNDMEQQKVGNAWMLEIKEGGHGEYGSKAQVFQDVVEAWLDKRYGR
jgi:hypothetical protein